MTTTSRKCASRARRLVVALALAVCACQSAGTTRMTAEDMDSSFEPLAASLLASPLFGRGPDPEPLIVAVERVKNLSSDLIPLPEQRALMAGLLATGDLRDRARRGGVTFLAPDAAPPAGLRATHNLSATFRSRSRAARDDAGHVRARSDLYQLDVELTDLRTGELVWVDGTEFKRAARGLQID